MRPRLTGFVILAGMRTGSNQLEQTLNGVPGLHCYGEVFNPVFVGHQGQDSLLGIDMAARAADPLRLWRRMVEKSPGLPGFRFFAGHDSRILDAVLPDPSVAKIILTRNPVDSHVSRLIAEQTGQWKLTHVSHRKPGLAEFDADRFAEDLAAQNAHHARIMRDLQTTGQAAFHIGYEDLGDPGVLTGLARFLGIDQTVAPATRLKRQNPEPLAEKVANFEDMAMALASQDRFNLHLHPMLEPARGAGVPGFVGGGRLPLLFMPLRGADNAPVIDWMARTEGCASGDLATGFTQKTLRQWMRAHPGFRSFTVFAHTLDRAHTALADLAAEPADGEMRRALAKGYALPLPGATETSTAVWRDAMAGFLAFLRVNLDGRTGLRTRSAWASQTALLQGMAAFATPELVLRPPDLCDGLRHLARHAGLPPAEAAPEAPATPGMPALMEYHHPDHDAAARAVWPRDYLHFGFGNWHPGSG